MVFLSKVNESGKSWLVLIIISLSAFIIAIDSTFMNVAISTLVVDLNTQVSTIQGIIAVYTLTMACLMLFGSKLMDIIGRKKTFVIGVFIYGIGTTIATISVNAGMLLIGWSILEGIGASFMMPATAAIITSKYEGQDRIFALGVWGAVGAMAAAIGPLFGGFLTTFLSWRYGFGIEIIIAIIILLYSRKIIESPTTLNWKDLDVMGALLAGVGFMLIVLGTLFLNSLSTWPQVAGTVGAGLIILALFFFWQKRRINKTKEPLLDVRIFKNRSFSFGVINIIVLNLGMAGALFIIPVFLQTVTGLNAFSTGLTIMPMTVAILIFAFTANKIANHIKATHLISLSFILSLIGALLLSNVFSFNTTPYDVIPGLVLIGIGIGLANPLLSDIIVSSVKSKKQSDASGVLNTGNNLGKSIGTALIGVILLVGTFTALSTEINNNYPQLGDQQIKDNIQDWVLKLQTTDLTLLKSQQSIAANIVNNTIAKAMNQAFMGLSIIFFIGVILSLFIREKEKLVIK